MSYIRFEEPPLKIQDVEFQIDVRWGYSRGRDEDELVITCFVSYWDQNYVPRLAFGEPNPHRTAMASGVQPFRFDLSAHPPKDGLEMLFTTVLNVNGPVEAGPASIFIEYDAPRGRRSSEEPARTGGKPVGGKSAKPSKRK